MGLSLEQKREQGYSKFNAYVVMELEIHASDLNKVNFFWSHVLDSIERGTDGLEVSVKPEWKESEL